MAGLIKNGSYVGTFTFQEVGSQLTGLDTLAATASADITSIVMIPASDGLNIHLYTFERTA